MTIEGAGAIVLTTLIIGLSVSSTVSNYVDSQVHIESAKAGCNITIVSTKTEIKCPGVDVNEQTN